jgi:predicted nucleic acid-binding protein
MITFDTGALIALERRKERAIKVYRAAREKSVVVASPSVVITEWWRGRTDWREKILAGIEVVSVDRALAALGGVALGKVRGATAVDAIVMAFAAMTGGVVYTSDVSDLEALTSFFPGVRVLAI